MKKPDLNELRRVHFEEHLLYHASPYNFERPSEELLLIDTKWHDNGGLGIWCSTFPNMCSKGFGKHIYQITPDADVNIFGWDYVSFKNFCCGEIFKNDHVKSRTEYFEIRNYLLSKNIDIIYIVDQTNFIGEVIFLNYNKIKSFEEVFSVSDKKHRICFTQNLSESSSDRAGSVRK